MYYSSMDFLECGEPGSCSRWTITGCTEVECKSTDACRNAKLVNNENVLCSVEGACQDAHIINGHKVTCGGNPVQRKFCKNAVIESDTIVICEGPGACMYDYANRMTLKVGAMGNIFCANINSKEMTCKNLIVEVSHASRACYDKYADFPRQCAILCPNSWDCDKSTIQFRILEE